MRSKDKDSHNHEDKAKRSSREGSTHSNRGSGSVHGHSHSHSASGNIKTAFFLNFSFTLIEIFGGIWTNSLAIVSDALHDLGDSFSLGLAWFLERYSRKKPDLEYSFGYSRFSLLGGMINTLVLIAGSVVVLTRAVPRIINPEASNARGMLLFSIMGIAINGIAALRMRGGKSLNERVVAWHLLEDVLGWCAILVVSIVLLFKDIHILDPLLSVVITSYVLYNVVRNMLRILQVFLQRVPEDISIRQLEDKITSIEGVIQVHHTHVWSLDGEHNLLSTHTVIPADTSREEQIELKNKIKEEMAGDNISHTTVEMEFQNEACQGEECRLQP